MVSGDCDEAHQQQQEVYSDNLYLLWMNIKIVYHWHCRIILRKWKGYNKKRLENTSLELFYTRLTAVIVRYEASFDKLHI